MGWALAGLALLWVLARRRLWLLWEDVQVARRQVELQAARQAALAPRLARVGGDDPAGVSMRADLADIEARAASARRLLGVEAARYRRLAPAWIAAVVGAPSPRRLAELPLEPREGEGGA